MIPELEPAAKKQRSEAEGAKTIWNWLKALETRWAKVKWSLQVLREQMKNSMCPYMLYYRPRPHIQLTRPSRLLWTRWPEMPRRNYWHWRCQQETNLAADNHAILKQRQQLQNLCPAQPRSAQTNRNYVARARPRPKPRQHRTMFSKQVVISLPCKLSFLSYRKCYVK